MSNRLITFIFLSCILSACSLMPLQNTAHDKIAYIQFTDGFWQVWLMDDKGGHTQQVTFDPMDKVHVSWFPDGERLLVNDAEGELLIANIISQKVEPLTIGLVGMHDAVVSPDGKSIAFSLSTSDSIDDNNIWVYPFETGRLRKLTDFPYLQHQPAWGNDSNWLYFVSGRGRQTHDIIRIDVNSANAEQLTSGQLYHFEVDVSPFGNLVFSNNQTGDYELWQWSLSQAPERLTHHEGYDADPSWDRSAQQIAFSSTRSGVLNIWKYNAKDGQVTQLTFNPVGARNPAWYRY